MKIVFSFLNCLLLTVLLNTFGFGQSEIPEDKKQLIGQIITLTKADKQIIEVTDIMLNSMENTYIAGFNQVIDNRKDLTPNVKEKMKSDNKKSYLSFSKRFRERLPEAVNYSKYVEDTIYPLYDKFFTTTELNDLVAFYKTSTGQKVIETMPALFKESTELARANLLPPILKLISDMMQEDLKNVEKLK